MNLVEIRITATVVTARYGTLSHGDTLRTDAAFARHLVEDCVAAKYTAPNRQKAPAPTRARRPRKAKETQP